VYMHQIETGGNNYIIHIVPLNYRQQVSLSRKQDHGAEVLPTYKMR